MTKNMTRYSSYFDNGTVSMYYTIMSTSKLLQDALHLSKQEVDIYLSALERSHNTVTNLSEATNIPRTAVYAPLKSLVMRGIVTEVILGKRTHYQALPPQHLNKILEQEKSSLNLAVAELEQSIDVPQDDMSVRHFRGRRGFIAAINILFDLSEPGSILRTVEHPTLLLDKYSEEVFDTYREKRLARNISAQVINPIYKMTPWLQERMDNKEKEKIDFLMISEEEYPRKAGFATTGKQLLIMNYHSVPSATLISNTEIAQTYESMHRMIWDRYKTS